MSIGEMVGQPRHHINNIRRRCGDALEGIHHIFPNRIVEGVRGAVGDVGHNSKGIVRL